MPKYTRKPTTVEAIQFKGVYREDTELMRHLAGVRYTKASQSSLVIHTLSGPQQVHPGDYVIFGTHDVYPCRADIFEAIYERVLEA